MKKKKKAKRGRPRKVFLPEKIEELIKKGKGKGFVTFSEILYFFPDLENDIKGLEKFLDELEKKGIEARERKEFLNLPEIKFCLKEVQLIEIKNQLDQISKEIKKAEQEKNFKRIEDLTKKFDQIAKNLLS